VSSISQKKFEKSLERSPGNKREKPRTPLSTQCLDTALPNQPIRRECLSSTMIPDPVGLFERYVFIQRPGGVSLWLFPRECVACGYRAMLRLRVSVLCKQDYLDNTPDYFIPFSQEQHNMFCDPYGRSLTAFGWINLPSYLHLYNMKSIFNVQPNPKITSKNTSKNRLKIEPLRLKIRVAIARSANVTCV